MTPDIEAELSALYAHRRAETRPLANPNGQTINQCECGKLSRTGTCSDCLSRKIRKLERSR